MSRLEISPGAVVYRNLFVLKCDENIWTFQIAILYCGISSFSSSFLYLYHFCFYYCANKDYLCDVMFSYLVERHVAVATQHDVGDVEVRVASLVEQRSLQLHELLHVAEQPVVARLSATNATPLYHHIS